jgi:hypothetical protein
MRHYVERHFTQDFEREHLVAIRYLRLIEKTFQRYLRRGTLEVSLIHMKSAAADLSISLKGWLDRDFFVRVSRQLERLLEETASSITFNIEEFHEAQLKHLNRLLKRLSRYGDRISITVHEGVRDMVTIDSSVFNLVLTS